MKSKKTCVALIILLVLMNLGTLGFFWFHKPGHNDIRGRDAAGFLIKELSLTSWQQGEFGKFRDLHRETMNTLQAHDRKLHDRFFEMIFLPVTDSARIVMLADSMALVRKDMELLTYSHFRKLRALLTTGQDEKFHEVFNQALDRVMPLPEPPAPPIPPPPSGHGRK